MSRRQFLKGVLAAGSGGVLASAFGSSSRTAAELHTCSVTQYGQKMRPPVICGEVRLSKPVKT